MYYIALWVAPIFEMKAYMPEGSKGSGSAHYQIDTSAEVRILLYAKGARIYRDLAQWKRVALITQRSQDRNLESRLGRTVLDLSTNSNSSKTLDSKSSAIVLRRFESCLGCMS